MKLTKRELVRQQQRRTYPYGMWTTETGEEILFNRSYSPILIRHLGVYDPMPIEEHRWIHNIKYQDFFFNDGTSPFKPFGQVKRVRDLVEWIRAVFLINMPIPDNDKVWKYGSRDSRRDEDGKP
jgi:hypothetical protein